MTLSPEEPRPKRDAARTKRRIFDVAKIAFASRGYAQTGIRDIAGRAGVNPALVLRYFKSKEALFEAVLVETLDTELLTAEGRRDFGRHVVRVLNKPRDENVAAMLVLAIADEDASAIAARQMESIVLSALAKWLGPPNAEARAARISVLCTGFMIYHRLLPIRPLAANLEVDTLDWLARALQEIVDDCGLATAPEEGCNRALT